MSDSTADIKRKVLERIKRLERERDDLALRIDELKVLVASIGRAAPTHTRQEQLGIITGAAPQYLADYIDAALRDAGPKGLTLDQLTKAVERLGYRTGGQTELKVIVASEVYRQIKKGGRGYVRVTPGRYAAA